jgi:hypothetical protein
MDSADTRASSAASSRVRPTISYASFAVVGAAKQFSATEPSKMLADLQSQEERLKALLPQLQRLSHKRESELAVQVFKGKEGVRSVFADFFEQKVDTFLFGDLIRFQQVVPLQLDKYFKFMRENGLFEHLVFPLGDAVNIDPVCSKYRTVPRKLVSSSAVWVYADRTILTVWSDPPLTIFIKSPEVAQNYRGYFDYLWNLAPRKDGSKRRTGRSGR